jgi:hypothetical protein
MPKEIDKLDVPDRNPFPQTLYLILEECSKQDFKYTGARWTSDGNEIEISQPSFVANTLSVYFRTCKYTSFSRNLNLYGFKKNPASSGIYSHPEFRQSDYEAVKVMRRPKRTKNARTAAEEPPQKLVSNKDATMKKSSNDKHRKHALSSPATTPRREEPHPAFTPLTLQIQFTKERRDSCDLASRGTKIDHCGSQERPADALSVSQVQKTCLPSATERSKEGSEEASPKNVHKRLKLMKENVGTQSSALASVQHKKVQENPSGSNRDSDQGIREPPMTAPRKIVRLVSRDNQMTLLEQVFPNDAFLQLPTSTNCKCNCKNCVYCCSSNCDSPSPTDAFPKTPPLQISGNGQHYNRAVSPLSLSPTTELDLHPSRVVHHPVMPTTPLPSYFS